MTDANNCNNCSYQMKHNDTIRIILWNVNSWTCENGQLRKNVLQLLNADIIYVLETKLKGDNVLEWEGYQWYGMNRRLQLRTARCGSGGVGLFIKNSLLSDWEFEIHDSSV